MSDGRQSLGNDGTRRRLRRRRHESEVVTHELPPEVERVTNGGAATAPAPANDTDGGPEDDGPHPIGAVLLPVAAVLAARDDDGLASILGGAAYDVIGVDGDDAGGEADCALHGSRLPDGDGPGAAEQVLRSAPRAQAATILTLTACGAGVVVAGERRIQQRPRERKGHHGPKEEP